MVIRATEPVAAGEEITIQYCSASLTFTEREKHLEGYLTECQCVLCKQDREDGPAARSRREELLKTAMSIDVAASNALTRLLALEKDIIASYRSERRVDPAFWEIPRRIAQALEFKASRDAKRGLLVKAVEEEMKALALLGIVVMDKSANGALPKEPTHTLPIAVDRIPGGVGVDTPSFAMINIVHLFRVLGDHGRAMRWLKAVIWRTISGLSLVCAKTDTMNHSTGCRPRWREGAFRPSVCGIFGKAL